MAPRWEHRGRESFTSFAWPLSGRAETHSRSWVYTWPAPAEDAVFGHVNLGRAEAQQDWGELHRPFPSLYPRQVWAGPFQSEIFSNSVPVPSKLATRPHVSGRPFLSYTPAQFKYSSIRERGRASLTQG